MEDQQRLNHLLLYLDHRSYHNKCLLSPLNLILLEPFDYQAFTLQNHTGLLLAKETYKVQQKGKGGKSKAVDGQGQRARASPDLSGDASSKNAGWRDKVLEELAEQSKKTDKPWSIKRGPEPPEPGIKYRGGSPPDPPPWAYHRSDIQAFQRWGKEVDDMAKTNRQLHAADAGLAET